VVVEAGLRTAFASAARSESRSAAAGPHVHHDETGNRQFREIEPCPSKAPAAVRSRSSKGVDIGDARRVAATSVAFDTSASMSSPDRGLIWIVTSRECRRATLARLRDQQAPRLSGMPERS